MGNLTFGDHTAHHLFPLVTTSSSSGDHHLLQQVLIDAVLHELNLAERRVAVLSEAKIWRVNIEQQYDNV